MIRTSPKLSIVVAILAEIFVFATLASAQEWKANQNPLSPATTGNDISKEDQGEVSPLLVTGDFNHDGIADIATIILQVGDLSEASHLTILLGQTNGTFKEKVSKPVPGHTPQAIVAGDFNKDGIPDLIIGDED